MGKRINDDIANMNISRQRKYQLRKLARGLCTNCGKPALQNMTRCGECHTSLMKLVYQSQGQPSFKCANTKFIRATTKGAETSDAKA